MGTIETARNDHPAVTRLRAAVDALADLDCRDLTGTEAAELSHALAGLQSRLDAVRLGALAQVQRSGVWALDGSRSAAAWLAREEGLPKAAAGADLKTARLLDEHLPATAAAVRAGDLPSGHARVITRTCTRTEAMRAMLGDPDKGETFLLTQAHLAFEDFQRFTTAWATRVDPDAADRAYRDATAARLLNLADTTDGTHITGFLPLLEAEALRTALRAEIGVPAATDLRSVGQRQADALTSIVARALGGGTLGQHASVRPRVVVHVPYSTLAAKADAVGIAPATLQETKAPLPRAILDTLMCDCELTRVVFGPDGQVLDVGRSQRTFTKALRRALDARDGGCMYPHCTAPAQQCEGHHTRPGGWKAGADTRVDEGILACWRHHTHIHAHDITITWDPAGLWVFHDKHGQKIGRSRPRSLGDPYDPWEDAA